MNLIIMNLVLNLCKICLVDQMANSHVNMNFNAFLEKTKLKDDGSNYTDWVRNLRIILIAARKQCPRRTAR